MIGATVEQVNEKRRRNRPNTSRRRPTHTEALDRMLGVLEAIRDGRAVPVTHEVARRGVAMVEAAGVWWTSAAEIRRVDEEGHL